MKYLSIALLLTGCFAHDFSDAIIGTAPDPKQKQKVEHLQKKMIAAEKKASDAEAETVRLKSALAEAQLICIEKQIAQLEKKWNQNPLRVAALVRKEGLDLFSIEREILHEIVQSGESVSQAQNLLDRILQMITLVSDADHLFSESAVR